MTRQEILIRNLALRQGAKILLARQAKPLPRKFTRKKRK